MPLKPNLKFDLFNVWCIEFMQPFVSCLVISIFRFFLRIYIFTRFGTPRPILSDKGSHFCNRIFEAFLDKCWVKNKVATPYHSQRSGNEVSNREIKSILEKTMNVGCTSQLSQLDYAFWDYRIGFKTPIGMSQYQLVFEKSC